MHQRRPVERGGGVGQSGDDLGRVVGHQPDVQKKHFFGQNIFFWPEILFPAKHPSPRGSQYLWFRIAICLAFRPFYARYGPDVRDGGPPVSAKRTMFDRGRGGPKSQFLVGRL